MSEYQYYEFQAVDRPLTAGEMRALRAVSTRADITSTRFTNHYEWGDFKGNPSAWMEKYFDGFLYLANWGSHELMLRLSDATLPLAVARTYLRGDSASAWKKNGRVILRIHSREEGGDDFDDDGGGWLSALLPLRGEIAAGDHRGLYLAWLSSVHEGEVEDGAREPSVPAGLAKLTGAQRALVDFLRIDTRLVEVAAKSSTPLAGPPASANVARWAKRLSPRERIDWLVRLATSDEQARRRSLAEVFARPAKPSSAAKRRTVADLLERAGIR